MSIQVFFCIAISISICPKNCIAISIYRYRIDIESKTVSKVNSLIQRFLAINHWLKVIFRSVSMDLIDVPSLHCQHQNYNPWRFFLHLRGHSFHSRRWRNRYQLSSLSLPILWYTLSASGPKVHLELWLYLYSLPRSYREWVSGLSDDLWYLQKWLHTALETP